MNMKWFELEERGQGLIEYGMIIIIIAILLLVLIWFLGEEIKEIYCEIILALRDGAGLKFPPLPSWCEALSSTSP